MDGLGFSGVVSSRKLISGSFTVHHSAHSSSVMPSLSVLLADNGFWRYFSTFKDGILSWCHCKATVLMRAGRLTSELTPSADAVLSTQHVRKPDNHIMFWYNSPLRISWSLFVDKLEPRFRGLRSLKACKHCDGVLPGKRSARCEEFSGPLCLMWLKWS